MYLSCLLIDVGTNPDRPRPGRLWLRNLYRVHQRLCMAFPCEGRKAENNDPHFLKPYDPDHFAHGSVHVQRAADAGFLFRVDPRPGGNPVVLVLSAHKPDWEYAFHNAHHLLASPPQEPRPLKLAIEAGTKLRFQLLANTVRRARKASLGADGKPLDPKWEDKRVPVPSNEVDLKNWLTQRAEPLWSRFPRRKDERPPGFRLEPEWVGVLRQGYVYVNKSGDRNAGHRLRSVLFGGSLEITDADAFRETLARGIGSAKAFGFGLLSVAPAG